jgi:multiple sugar transport system substrate-binding protein
MKKARKSSWWSLLALSLILSMLLASCAPAAAPETTPQVIRETVVVTEVVTETVIETQIVEITPEAPPPVEGEEGGPMLNPDVSGNIELWHFWASPVRRNAIRRVIAICQEQLPNITVTDTVKPFGDIWTANIAAVAAGSGMPDVIVSDRPTLPKDADQGIYMSLQEWADRDNVNRDQFYDWAWDQGVFNGEIYGIPHETDVRVLFWNKQLFEAAGLDPERPPQTWSEVEEYADVLDVQNPDGTYQRIGFMPLLNTGFDIWTFANDAELIAEDGTPQINNPKAVETLDWIKSWIDRYGGWQAIQDFRAQFGAPPNDVFMGNGVAMFVDIFGYNSFLEFYRPRADTADPIGEVTDADPRMDWGIALMPHGDDADSGTWSGGFSMSIPTGAANPEAAWEFIKCATGAEGQSSWARDTQAQPTNISAAQDPVLQASPGWQVVDQALATSSGGVQVPAYPNWGEQLGQRYEQVWTGAITPQQALDEAQAAVEAETQ